ncbi:MAG: TIGR01777 family oxidoreductase [Bacteroidota bacterium]
MAVVLIGGGSGLVGTRLSELLIAEGHEVRHFSRSAKTQGKIKTFQWDVNAGTYDAAAFKNVTHVINFAGAGIVDKRWTNARKKVIIESRTQSTRLLKKGIAEHGQAVKAYLAASAIGYYGDRGETLVDETSAPGDGFLSESVLQWEAATAEVPDELQLPTLIVRIGIVLSTKGGALPQMLLPLNFLTSVYFGDGQQWYSWIHIDDICRIFIKGIEDKTFRGLYNGVAPNPQRNKDFAQALIDATDSSALLVPSPVFAMKIALGEMAHTVLDSNKVSAQKAQEAGFEFQYPQLVEAVRHLKANDI